MVNTSTNISSKEKVLCLIMLVSHCAESHGAVSVQDLIVLCLCSVSLCCVCALSLCCIGAESQHCAVCNCAVCHCALCHCGDCYCVVSLICVIDLCHSAESLCYVLVQWPCA